MKITYSSLNSSLLFLNVRITSASQDHLDRWRHGKDRKKHVWTRHTVTYISDRWYQGTVTSTSLSFNPLPYIYNICFSCGISSHLKQHSSALLHEFHQLSYPISFATYSYQANTGNMGFFQVENNCAFQIFKVVKHSRCNISILYQ